MRIKLIVTTILSLFILGLVNSAEAAVQSRLRCEFSADRSKVSYDGKGFSRNGRYIFEISSGGNSATSGQLAPNNRGEIETDWDSDGGNIAQGAIAIDFDFVQGGLVSGVIKQVTNTGSIVVIQNNNVPCRQR